MFEVGSQPLRQSRERYTVMCHVKFCSDMGVGGVGCFLGSLCEVISLSVAIQAGQVAIQSQGEGAASLLRQAHHATQTSC